MLTFGRARLTVSRNVRVITLVLLLAAPLWAQETRRTYAIVELAAFARAGSVHTHVQVTGWVAATHMERDGDRHIKLVPSPGARTQWKAVPSAFGSGSTCHRRFQQWAQDGTWQRLWADQLRRYDREHGWWEVHPVEAILP